MGHLGCFQLMAVINNITEQCCNKHVSLYLSKLVFWIFLVKPRSEITGHVEFLFLNFWGPFTLLFILIIPIYFPIFCTRVLVTPQTLQHLFLMDNSQYDSCKWVSHCFGLHFPNKGSVCEYLPCTYWISVFCL